MFSVTLKDLKWIYLRAICVGSFLSLSLLLTGCGGAYQGDDAYSAYSMIPATNNPSVTRHNATTWQPGTKY